jgi:hypothetical protein
MGWLRIIGRVGILWLLSIVVAVAGMEFARRLVLATENRPTTQATTADPSAISAQTDQVPLSSASGF